MEQSDQIRDIWTESIELNNNAEKLAQALQSGIEKQKSTEYQLATPETQKAFDDLIEQAKNQFETAKYQVLKELINNNLQKTNLALTKLIKEIQDAELDWTNEKAKIIAEINKLKLTNGQKEQLSNDINSAKTYEQAENILNTAKSIVPLTQKLEEQLANTKNFENETAYRLATPQNQIEYNDTVSGLKKDLNASTNKLVTVKALEGAIQQLKDAANSLNGKDILDTAKIVISKLKYLSNKQKDTFNNELNDAQSIKQLKDIVDSATKLNDKIEEATKELEQLKKDKESTNYKHSDSVHQNNLKTTSDTLNNSLDDINKNAVSTKQAKEKIEQLTNELNDLKNKKSSLNGNKKITTEAIDKSKLLSNEQKNTAKEKLNKINPLTEEKARELLTNELPLSKQIAQDKLNSFNSLTPEEKEKIIKAIQNANLTFEANKAFDEKVSNTLDTSGDLKTTINKLLNEVNNLTNLTKNEQNQIKEEITNSVTTTQAQDIFDNANKLNNSINKFIDDVNNYLNSNEQATVENDLKQIKELGIKTFDNSELTPIDSINKIVTLAKELNKLNAALKEYLNSTYGTEAYQSGLESFKTVIMNASKMLSNTDAISLTHKLFNLEHEIYTDLKDKVANSNKIIQLVNSIAKKNKLETQTTLDKINFINQSNEWTKELNNFLNSSNYFNIVSSSSKLTEAEFKKLIAKIQKLTNLPNVISSTLQNNCKIESRANNQLWWLLLIPLTLGVGAIIWWSFFAKHKKNK
ncbi:hypothetical protein [Mycoplasma hafezii]|uniref:hypothetical protein n=1 Tax=Mycoplasma hafezii TaxID=525886 RepID=UPI003CE8E9E8